MNIPAVEKETELQMQKMKQIEQELDNLYSEIVGTEKNGSIWRENYIKDELPKINVKTGEPITKNNALRLKRKFQRYTDTRNLLMMLTDRNSQLNNYQLFDKNYLARTLDKYGVKAGNTVDKELLSKLNEIKNLPPIEAMTKAKDVICEHLGLPKELIEVAEVPPVCALQEYSAAFMPQLGKIYYHPTVKSMPSDVLIALIRHELDHAEVFAKTAKSIGLNEFKDIICQGIPKAKAIFNEELWTQILKNIKVGDFDTKFYEEAIKNYQTATRYNLRQNISYMSNPLEQRAYRVGFDMQYALNGGNIAMNNTNTLITSIIYARLEEKIKILKSIFGEKLDEFVCVNTLHESAIKSIKNPTSLGLNLEIYEKMLELIDKGIEKAIKRNLKLS